VFIARLLEGLIEFWIDTGSAGEAAGRIITSFSWHRFSAVQIWIFVLFLIYTFVSELNERLGKGELARILFSHRVPAVADVAERKT
jgi:hypothetical protein